MSDAERRRGPKPYNGVVKSSVCEPGDEQPGEWSRERLIQMNERFVQRVERAFENGTESRQLTATSGADSAPPR
jgi:hypothetical protein